MAQPRIMTSTQMVRRLLIEATLAGRSLARSPRYALFGVLTIALAVGLGSAIYAVIHAALFRPRVLPNPERLVNIYGPISAMPLASSLPRLVIFHKPSVLPYQRCTGIAHKI